MIDARPLQCFISVHDELRSRKRFITRCVSFATFDVSPISSHGELKDIDNDECDVVLLGCGSGLPVPNLGEHLIHQIGWKARLIVANDFFQPTVAKEFAAGILGIDHAVGVEEKAVAGLDGHVANGVVGLRYDSKNYAVAFDALQFPSPPPLREHK